LARLIREWLSKKLGSEWNRQFEAISDRRAQLRAEGLPPQEVSQRLRDFVAERNWLS
jgi:hypothetical protein